MALNGIDISGWQPNIDLTKVPGDFVIIKATEGTEYTSPKFADQMANAKKAGKLLGVYHYINGSGAAAEMKHFLEKIKPYLDQVLLCLDWEGEGNSRWGNTSYLKQCIEELKKLTNKTIVLYASASSFPWDIVNATKSKAWVAQYANYEVTGYQSTPWNEGAYQCFIRQYSSSGRLKGYDGSLDLNKCYGTKADWERLAGTSSTTTSKPVVTKPTAQTKPSKKTEHHVYLQAKSGGKVLPMVMDAKDNAGVDKPMEYLAAWATPGTLRVQAKTARNGWLPELKNPKNIKNAKTGSVGDGSNMTGLRMYYESPNRDHAIKYRVKTQRGGWLAWMVDHKDTGGSKDDFAGDGSPILRVEARIISLK